MRLENKQNQKNFLSNNNHYKLKTELVKPEERPEEFTQKQYKEKIDGKL